jgi:membrane-associated phospholipid phosphatase
MQFLTDFADQAVILPLAVAIGLALLVAGWRRGAAAWLGAVGATLGMVLLSKVAGAACLNALALLDLQSPSGHTASAAVVYGGLIALTSPEPARPVRRWIAALLPAAALAVLVGATRLAVHAHTVAEVLAGAAIGIAGALALARLAGRQPAGLQVSVPWAAAVVVAVVMHGRHLQAEDAIDRLSCRLASAGLAAPPQAPSAMP